MLVSDILVSVRRRLRQTQEATSNWQNVDLLTYVNDRRATIADSVGANRKTVTMGGSSSGSYALPGDLLRIESATFNGETLLPVSLIEADFNDDGWATGQTGYTIQGNTFYMTPRTVSGEVRLNYIAYPARVESDQASLDLPNTMLNCLVFGVVADCYLELGNMDRGNYWESRFIQELDRQKRRERLRQHPFRDAPDLPAVCR